MVTLALQVTPDVAFFYKLEHTCVRSDLPHFVILLLDSRAKCLFRNIDLNPSVA